LLLFLNIASLAYPAIAADIVEEALPSVVTIAEIDRQITLFEGRLVEKKADNAEEDFASIRGMIDRFLQENPGISSDISKQVIALQDRIDTLEGAYFFYQNKNDAAKTAFRNLLKRSPQATLDGNVATPALAEFFENLREKLIGYVSIKSNPGNADVYADGVLIGKTPLIGAYIVSGEIVFRAEKEGYFPDEKKATIKPGKETSIELSLPPNSGSCTVLTVPTDVSVYLDGKLVGKTSGNLPADMIEKVSQSNLNPLEASAPLIIDSIAIGQHVIEFQKSCYKSLKFKVDIDIGEFFMPPVKLEPSYSNFEIHSSPASANVSIEGDFVGQTPVRQERGCAGLREVRIDLGTTSNWFERVDFSPDKKTTIHARPRPTVLVLGCANVDPSERTEAIHRIEGWLIQSGQFNVISGEEAQKYQNRAAVTSFVEKLSAPSLSAIRSWESMTSSLGFALKESGASLYAFVRHSDVNSEVPGTLFLLHPALSTPDRFSIPSGLPAEKAPDELIRFLQRFPVVTEFYTGLHVVDSSSGIMIVSIDPEGPAAITSLQTGTIIREINGQPVDSVQAMKQIIGSRSGNEIMLGYTASGTTATLPIKGYTRPVMIPAGDPNFPYNYCVAKLTEQVVFTDIRDAAYLNIGLCFIAKGSPKSGLDLGLSQANLGEGAGINAHSASYLKAWAAYQTGLYEMSEAYLKDIPPGASGRLIDGNGPSIDLLIKNGFKD